MASNFIESVLFYGEGGRFSISSGPSYELRMLPVMDDRVPDTAISLCFKECVARPELVYLYGSHGRKKSRRLLLVNCVG